MSRSEFFARAAEYYLEELDAQSLTTQIDAALDHLDLPDESTITAIEAGHQALAETNNEW